MTEEVKEPKVVKVRKTVSIPIEKLVPMAENPNYMSEKQFNRLVKAIRDDGFDENIQVSPHEQEGKFHIIGGHHRVNAAKFLGIKEVPCVVHEKITKSEEREMMNVRKNIIKGRIDPLKFTKIVNNLAKKGLDRYVVQEKLNEEKGNIKSLEDLTNVLNQLYTEFGDTLKHSYMFFTHGSKVHLMVQMTPSLRKMITLIAKQCEFDDKNINEALMEIFSNVGVAGADKTDRNVEAPENPEKPQSKGD